MFRIAICDDDSSVCEELEKVIRNYLKKALVTIKLDIYNSGFGLYCAMEEGISYNLIFLNTKFEANSDDGIEVGTRIRNEIKDETVQIIYISDKNQYADKIFDARPIHFLLKPINRQSVEMSLKKSIKLSKIFEHLFLYKRGKYENKIPVKDILYFESHLYQIRIVLRGREEVFYGRLSDVYNELSQFHFFFICKSCLVNYESVAQFGAEKIKLINGKELEIGRGRGKELCELQVKYERALCE